MPNPMPLTLTQPMTIIEANSNRTMNPPILFAISRYLYTDKLDMYVKATPVVRYSDHCATVQAKDQLIRELTRELERMALLCEELQVKAEKPNPTIAIDHYQQNKPLDQFIGSVAKMGLRVAGKLPGTL